MVLAKSSTMPLGSKAPAFSLPDTRNGDTVSTEDFTGQALLVVFMCNHCPYVVHLVDELTKLANTLDTRGLKSVCISSNDVRNYPADSPEKMGALATAKGFNFPYCFDESQETAKAYGAICTPDIFLFDQQHQLYYHGQFDDTRPGRGTQATGEDLRIAAEKLLAGEPAPEHQSPSVGCSIKWKAI